MLRELLGDELWAQVSEKLKGQGPNGKDVELVVGNDGSYVPASKYEDLKGQFAQAEDTLKSVSTTMKELGGTGDPAKLQEDIQAAQNKVKQTHKDYEANLTKIKKVSAVKRSLIGKVHDPNDVMGFIDVDGIELDSNDDLKTDIEKQLAPYRESKPYLFKEQKEQHSLKGAVPADPNPTKQKALNDQPVAF